MFRFRSLFSSSLQGLSVLGFGLGYYCKGCRQKMHIYDKIWGSSNMRKYLVNKMRDLFNEYQHQKSRATNFKCAV